MTSNNYLFELFPVNKDKSRIVCVMTGSDGGIDWAKKISKEFNTHKIPSCAFAYWNYKHLTKKLSQIPVEAVESMVNYLKEKGYKKVYLYGLSKGGELSLLYASLFSNIDGVIAVSPPCAIFEGYSLTGYSNHSPWTFKEKEIPYICAFSRKFNLLTMYLANGGYAFLNIFTKAFNEGFSDENRIKIENATCKILFISAKNDSVWDSAKMCNLMIEKLKSVNYKYQYKHISFEKASHVLCPIKSPKLKVFPQERQYPKDCTKSRNEAFKATIKWIMGDV